MSAQLMTSVPILISNDFDATAAFYGKFGFHEVGRNGAQYLILRRDGAELHFTPKPDHDTSTSWHSCYIRVLNFAELTRAWADLDVPREGYPRYQAAEMKPWGMIEAHILDADGNLITLGALGESPD
ncbi:MAG: VOC family protein [Pseudomonadota bacterium]